MSKTFKLSFLVLVLFLALPAISFSQDFDSSKSISNFRADDLNVELISTPGSYKLEVTPNDRSFGSPVTDARVFWLKQPSRLVVDVMQFSSSSAYKEEVRSVDIASVRTGIHKEKVRIVIDIRDELVPDYNSNFDSTSGGFIVDFNFSGRKSHSLDSDPAPERKTIPKKLTQLSEKPRDTFIKSKPEPIPSPDEISRIIKEDTPPKKPKKIKPPKQVVPAPGVIEVPEPKKAAPPKKIAKKIEPQKIVEKPKPAKATKKSAILSGIEFRELLGQESSALFVDVDSPANFSLEKKDSSVYELTLENTKLKGVNLSLPQFPPDAFEGFEVVVCRQRGEDVVVRIYTPEGTTLTPFRAKGKLWVKAK